MKLDVPLFLQLPEERQKRILHPGTVTRLDLPRCGAIFDNGSLPLGGDQAVRLFFDQRRQFVQQAAVIEALATEECPSITFLLHGEPVSAESRQHYRVSTIGTGLSAAVGPDAACELQDVSATGFAVISRTALASAQVLPVELTFEGSTYGGQVQVQSTRALAHGRFRHGLHCIVDRKARHAVSGILPRLNMSAQRAQMRRLSGN